MSPITETPIINTIGSSTISRESAEERQCSITQLPLTELDNLLQALPCGHIFDADSIQTWAKQQQTCPEDRINMVAFNKVVVLQKGETETRESKELNETSSESENLSAADQQKLEAIRRLENSLLVAQVPTKNFRYRFKEITTKSWRETGSITTVEYTEYTGKPIDQLYKEYWNQASLPNYAQAEAIINTAFYSPTGKEIGGGAEIRLGPKN